MSVLRRRDSPYWYLWLETTHRCESTKIRIGRTAAERTDSRRLADELYATRMLETSARIHRLPSARPSITFAAFADWYDDHVAAHLRSHDRVWQITKRLRETFGPRPLGTIAAADVLQWRTARLRDVSAGTVNRELDVLKAMFKVAIPTYLEASPLVGLKRLRVERHEPYVLSREEETRLLAALQPNDRALILCALDTLLRLSDILRLRREHDRGSYLVVEDSKVNPYKVPVSVRLRQALDGLPNRGPFYFGHRRLAELERDHRGSVQSCLERACKVAKIPYGRKQGGLTFHCLRHTGATRLAEAGVSMRTIQELGGWQSLRMLERYAHPSEEAKARAVELIGGAA